MSRESTIRTSPSFCCKCGSILPLLQEFGPVICYSCKNQLDVDEFGNIKFQYTIHFNTVVNTNVDNLLTNDEAEGPVVERRCPKCDNDRMSYATLQLRSADEGQTVFYTCTSCKFKETENS